MKFLILDMDGVISESRTPASLEMIKTLSEILEYWGLCVISGGPLKLFRYQFLDDLMKMSPKTVHVMPTSGTQYYMAKMGGVIPVFVDSMSTGKKEEVMQRIYELIQIEGVVPLTDDQIEDRGSQVTFSALGRSAPLEAKKAFDPDGVRRKAWLPMLQIDGVEVRVGGTTSIDFTMQGQDKGEGLRRFLCLNPNLSRFDCVFIGDKLSEGGNDCAVKRTIPIYLEVKNPEETLGLLKSIINMRRIEQYI